MEGGAQESEFSDRLHPSAKNEYTLKLSTVTRAKGERINIMAS